MQPAEAGSGEPRLPDLRSLQEMEGRRGAWNRLVLQDAIAAPFRAREWSLGTVKCRAGRVRLRIVPKDFEPDRGEAKP